MKKSETKELKKELVELLAELALDYDFETTIEGWRVSDRNDDAFGAKHGFNMYMVIQHTHEPKNIGWQGCIKVENVGGYCEAYVDDETTFYKRKKKTITKETWGECE